jgi:hypothetical protein
MDRHTTERERERERKVIYSVIMKVWGRRHQPGGVPLTEDTKANVYLYRLEAHSENPIYSELCSSFELAGNRGRKQRRK